MYMASDQLEAALKGLIRSCRAGEEGFRNAACGVQDEHLRLLLNNYAQQRAQLAAEMHRELEGIGGFAGPDEWPGSAHNAWGTPFSLDGWNDDTAILIECERRDGQVLAEYGRLLGCKLPFRIRQTLSRQQSAIQSAQQRMHELEQTHAKTTNL